MSTRSERSSASIRCRPARLAAAARPRLAQPRRRDHRRPVHRAGGDLELAPLADGALVDVAGEDQLGAGVDERPEDGAAARDRPLAAPPGCAGQVVVERDDA